MHRFDISTASRGICLYSLHIHGIFLKNPHYFLACIYTEKMYYYHASIIIASLAPLGDPQSSVSRPVGKVGRFLENKETGGTMNIFLRDPIILKIIFSSSSA